MWIMTKWGFFSCVCGQKEDGAGVDFRVIMIRARKRSHLEALRDEVMDDQSLSIFENEGTDYPFRIIVSYDTFIRAMVILAGQVNYGNFKNEAAHNMKSPAYNAFLHDVWDSGRMLERMKG